MSDSVPVSPAPFARVRAFVQSPESLAGLMGFLGLWVTFFPPDLILVKLCYVFSFASLTIAIIRASIKDKAEQAKEQRKRDQRDEERHRELTAKLAGVDTQRLRSARDRARFLADQILAFLTERNAKSENDTFDLSDPAFHAKWTAQVIRWNEYYKETKMIYAERFLPEAQRIAADLARAGLIDEEILLYSQHSDPPIAEQFAQRLRDIPEVPLL